MRWAIRANAALRLACAIADDHVQSGTPWYVWVQDELDTIYAEMEIKPAKDRRPK